MAGRTLTKIAVTLGPASGSEDTIYRMAREGAEIFRINYSHGDPRTWEQYTKAVRRVEERLGRPLAIMGDIVGPKVRIGVLPEQEVRRGDVLYIVHADRVSEDKLLPLPSLKVYEALSDGDVVLVDDGRIRLQVEEVEVDRVRARVLTGGKLLPRKTFVLPHKEVSVPLLTDKDRADLAFSVKAGVDYIAVSFATSREHVRLVRNVLAELGADGIKVIAKVETPKGVNNSAEIIEESDGIMVARGDLGMYYPLYDIPFIQRRLIEEARTRGKPVVVATQFLESMITETTPTRSEVVDVMNAVTEGCDALLLTAETAIGRNPVDAVRWLSMIIAKAEQQPEVYRKGEAGDLRERFARGVVELAENLEGHILVYSIMGYTPLLISKFRPKRGLYVGVPRPELARSLLYAWGVRPLVVPAEGYDEGLRKTFEYLRERDELSYGDIVVQTYGLREREHVVKIVQVS